MMTFLEPSWGPNLLSPTPRINTPRKEGGLGPLNIPLLADVTRKLSSDYGVLKEDEGIAYRYCGNLGKPPSSGWGDHSHPAVSRESVLPPRVLTVGAPAPHCELQYLRGLFVIDGKGVLRQVTINDLPVGRSVDEALRLVQAFQYTDEHGEGEHTHPVTCVHTWVHTQPLCRGLILQNKRKFFRSWMFLFHQIYLFGQFTWISSLYNNWSKSLICTVSFVDYTSITTNEIPYLRD